jgi:hypothetical protein
MAPVHLAARKEAALALALLSVFRMAALAVRLLSAPPPIAVDAAAIIAAARKQQERAAAALEDLSALAARVAIFLYLAVRLEVEVTAHVAELAALAAAAAAQRFLQGLMEQN